jgi:ubiquinone/menaquinone biosynthesis C-methylase UbiE
MSNHWDQSAEAWIADMDNHGDFSREFVLDGPMLKRIDGRGFANALDVGCGEGRFCRMLRDRGIAATGIDPTLTLVRRARACDPAGDYREGVAERLEFADASFDLVVSYLTLIDIPDIRKAIPEMVRVLKPGGALLIANLNSFFSASATARWIRGEDGTYLHFPLDTYLEERCDVVSWRTITIDNWHRPFSVYMKLLLEQQLQLVHFDEPAPIGGDRETAERYRRVPWHMLMEWRKSAHGA